MEELLYCDYDTCYVTFQTLQNVALWSGSPSRT